MRALTADELNSVSGGWFPTAPRETVTVPGSWTPKPRWPNQIIIMCNGECGNIDWQGSQFQDMLDNALAAAQNQLCEDLTEDVGTAVGAGVGAVVGNLTGQVVGGTGGALVGVTIGSTVPGVGNVAGAVVVGGAGRLVGGRVGTVAGAYVGARIGNATVAGLRTVTCPGS